MNIVIAKMKLAGLRTTFMDFVKSFLPAWQDAATLVPSDKAVEDYSWLGDVAELEEWKDELIPRGLKEYSYTLKNKRFGGALEVEKDDLSDDLYGGIQLRVRDLAQKGRQYPGRLVSNLRIAGKTGLAYDGVAFYATTHAESGSNQANLVSGTGTTDAQITADFESAYAKITSFVTDKSTPVDRTGMKLVAVCGPAMVIKLNRNLMAKTVGAGGENVLSGMVSAVEVDPLITTNDWYIEDRGHQLKAFLVQEREKLTPNNTAPGSDTDVLRDQVIFTAKWRGNVGYGLWQHSVMIDN